MTTAIEELRGELAATLAAQFEKTGPIIVTPEVAREMVDKFTAEWRVTKGSPTSHEHPLYDGPEMVRLAITTKPRELNAEELAERERWLARSTWKYSENKDEAEPPTDTNVLDLLDQRTWWITKDRQVMQVDDMAPSHRANTLGLLRRGANTLHLAYGMQGVFSNAPDEVTNELAEGNPAEWLEEQPLVKRLRKLVKRDLKAAASGKAPA